VLFRGSSESTRVFGLTPSPPKSAISLPERPQPRLLPPPTTTIVPPLPLAPTAPPLAAPPAPPPSALLQSVLPLAESVPLWEDPLAGGSSAYFGNVAKLKQPQPLLEAAWLAPRKDSEPGPSIPRLLPALALPPLPPLSTQPAGARDVGQQNLAPYSSATSESSAASQRPPLFGSSAPRLPHPIAVVPPTVHTVQPRTLQAAQLEYLHETAARATSDYIRPLLCRTILVLLRTCADCLSHRRTNGLRTCLPELCKFGCCSFSRYFLACRFGFRS
jgi:hypothetical protein